MLFLNSILALDIIIAVLLMVTSYIIGSIPFGLLIGKIIKGIDIREHGSKNIGSTNAIRVLGKKIGFLVFFCDVFKGMLIIILVKLLAHFNIWVSPIEEMWYGAAAIVGHGFPLLLNFKGGKVVATSLGVVIILSPLSAISCLLIFLLVLYITGYVSLASTFAALTVVTAGWILYFFGMDATNILEYFVGKTTLSICLLFSIATVLIILKHLKNYKRLLNGTENNFKKNKKLKKEQNH